MNQSTMLCGVGLLITVLVCYYMYREVSGTRRDLDATNMVLRSMQDDISSAVQSGDAQAVQRKSSAVVAVSPAPAVCAKPEESPPAETKAD